MLNLAAGRAGAAAPAGVALPAGRARPAALPRRRRALRHRSPLEGPGAVPRVLPRRQRPRRRRQPPDRLDGAGAPLHRGPGAPAGRPGARPRRSRPAGSRRAGDERAHRGRRPHRVAGGRRPGRLRLGDHARRAHPAVSRAAAGGHDAPDRPHGAGQRTGCLGRSPAPGRSFSPASAMRRACSRPSTGRRSSRSWTSRGRRGPIAWPTAAASSTSCSCPHGRAARGAPVAAGRAARRGASLRGAPVPLGARLARAAPREPGVPLRGGRRRGSESTWHPYDGVPAVHALSNGSYRAEPQWYRGFLYSEERARGLDDTEDLAAPGVFQWDLAEGDAVLLLGADGALAGDPDAAEAFGRLRRSERARRARFATPPGARGRRLPGTARSREDHRGRLSLVHGLGARHVHRPPGTLPRDRPPGRRAVHPARVGGPGLRRDAAQPLRRPGRRPRVQHGRRVALVRRRRARVSRGRRSRGPPARPRATARPSARPCRRSSPDTCGARATASGPTDDGLLAAGEPGVQLTWMDAKVGRLGGDAADREAGRDPGALAQRAPHRRAVHAELRADSTPRASRASRAASGTPRPAGSTTWWMPITCPGRLDPTLRPNQILAVGGLPYPLLEGEPCPPGRGRGRAAALDPARSPDAGARRGRATPRATRAAFASATARTTRARSGPGCWARSWRPGSGCGASGADVRARGPAAVLRAAAGPSRRGRRGPHLGDRRRGAAAHAAGLPVPGVVGGRGAPARPAGPGDPRASPGGKAAACAARRWLSRSAPARAALPRRSCATCPST